MVYNTHYITPIGHLKCRPFLVSFSGVLQDCLLISK